MTLARLIFVITLSVSILGNAPFPDLYTLEDSIHTQEHAVGFHCDAFDNFEIEDDLAFTIIEFKLGTPERGVTTAFHQRFYYRLFDIWKPPKQLV